VRLFANTEGRASGSTVQPEARGLFIESPY
jgi:hypothetical protein